MKRSEINAIMREADDFIKQRGFCLPPFAYWTPDEWAGKGSEVSGIVENGLGWDITDFGWGDYKKYGLLLFTLRNGILENLKQGRGKFYAEKIMVVGVDQITPMHFHWSKTEDIINRGGGNLVIQLHNAAEDEDLSTTLKPRTDRRRRSGTGLADTEVTVNLDGVERTVKAGETFVLTPGESITLPPYCYHKFWGAESRVLVGEVSTVNDDNSDNRFHKPVGRFPDIEEDEPPLYLLVNDYTRYFQY